MTGRSGANPGEDASDLTFDHIGIVVRDIEKGTKQLRGLLGPLIWTRRFDDTGLGVSVVFARDSSGLVYELIAPFGDTSPVAGALKAKSNLLNQIAYRTPNLEAAVARLRKTGALPVGVAKPAMAFGGARVQFLMSPLGFIVELIEGEAPVHVFGGAASA